MCAFTFSEPPVAANSWPGEFQSTPCHEWKYMNAAPPTMALFQVLFWSQSQIIIDRSKRKKEKECAAYVFFKQILMLYNFNEIKYLTY